MKRTRCAGHLVALCIAAVIGVPQIAEAIPAYARKYNTTCSRCHIGFPKLNTFGKNFRLHGYQQPGDAKTKKLISDDDPNLSLIEQVPLAIVLESSLDFPEWIGETERNSFGFLEEVGLFYGDTLAPDIGFFGHVSFEDGGAQPGKNNIVFSHLGGKNVFLQFGLLDLMENGVNPHYSLTRAPYAIFASDVGNFALHNLVGGIRLYGMVGSTITPELVRGDNGADGDSANGFTPVFGYGQDLTVEDEGSPYDTMGGIIWEVAITDGSVGGHGHGGGHAEGTSPGVNDYWGRVGFSFADNSQVGLFGYTGNSLMEEAEPLVTPGSPLFFDNDFSMYGADLTWEFGKPIDKAGVMQKPYILQAAFVVGRADNPHAEVGAMPAGLNGYFVELAYLTSERGILVGRYDRVHSRDIGSYNRESFTLNYSHYMRTNFVIAGELTKGLAGGSPDSLSVFMKFAF